MAVINELHDDPYFQEFIQRCFARGIPIVDYKLNTDYQWLPKSFEFKVKGHNILMAYKSTGVGVDMYIRYPDTGNLLSCAIWKDSFRGNMNNDDLFLNELLSIY